MLRKMARTIVVVMLCAAAYAGEEKSLAPEKEFMVPRFKDDFPSIFDDVMYDEAAKKLIVANSVGMGEFPVKDGDIVFAPPGFTAACPNCDMRGFVKTKDVQMSALLWKRLVISISKPDRTTADYTVPGVIRVPTGISHDGECYLVADRASNTVFKLKLDNGRKVCIVVSKVVCEKEGVQTAGAQAVGVEAVTFYDGRMWTTNGQMLYEHGKDGKVEARWKLGVKLSGIAFGEGKLWATGLGERKMYRFANPDPDVAAAPPEKDNPVVFVAPGSGKYHRAWCKYIKPDAKQVLALDAEQQGYTPCESCSTPPPELSQVK
jgi:hypothetical protein